MAVDRGYGEIFSLHLEGEGGYPAKVLFLPTDGLVFFAGKGSGENADPMDFRNGTLG